jgi:hypothetical protein
MDYAVSGPTRAARNLKSPLGDTLMRRFVARSVCGAGGIYSLVLRDFGALYH